MFINFTIPKGHFAKISVDWFRHNTWIQLTKLIFGLLLFKIVGSNLHRPIKSWIYLSLLILPLTTTTIEIKQIIEEIRVRNLVEALLSPNKRNFSFWSFCYIWVTQLQLINRYTFFHTLIKILANQCKQIFVVLYTFFFLLLQLFPNPSFI